MLELNPLILYGTNRLGHPHLCVLNTIMKLLRLPSCTARVCEFCLYGKMHKLSFPRSQNISLYPLQLIHSDV